MKRVDPEMTARARSLRRAATLAERLLWRMLSKQRPRFTRQLVVGTYILDLACREARVAIELDGSQHLVTARYDARRTAFLEHEGWHVVRFWNNDVMANPEGVAEAVLGAVQVRLAGSTHPRPLPSREGGSKAVVRAEAVARRAAGRPEWGVRLAGHVLAAGLVPPSAVVAGFWPLPGEIDVRPLLLALVGRGHAVALPETPPRGQPLRFRRWRPGTAMVAERFGTVRPDGPVLTPTLLLVPLLAFDRAGRRLGYGGGYYDRTIAALPGVRAIGCGFAVQQVDAVPVLPHDAVLHAVATEAGIVWPEG